MKKILTPAVISVFFAAFFTLTSCKKEVDPPMEELILGKWTMNAAIGNYTDYGVYRTDTTWFTTNDYFDFKADGTVSIVENEVSHNGNWKIVNNKLIFTNTGYMDFNGGFDLPILTQSDLQLYYIHEITDHHLEAKLNLKR